MKNKNLALTVFPKSFPAEVEEVKSTFLRGDAVTIRETISGKKFTLYTRGPCNLEPGETLHTYRNKEQSSVIGIYGIAHCGPCLRSKPGSREGDCPIVFIGRRQHRS